VCGGHQQARAATEEAGNSTLLNETSTFIRRKFAQLNRDGNGTLDQTALETLVRWTYSLIVSNGVLTNEEVKSEAAKLSRLLDRNLDGRVTTQAFEKYYERLITMARELADKGLQRGIHSPILAEPPSGLWAVPAARTLLLGASDSSNALSRLQPTEHLMGMILNPIISEAKAIDLYSGALNGDLSPAEVSLIVNFLPCALNAPEWVNFDALEVGLELFDSVDEDQSFCTNFDLRRSLQAIAQWPANLATMLCHELNVMDVMIVDRDDWKEILSIVPEHPIHAAGEWVNFDALEVGLKLFDSMDEDQTGYAPRFYLRRSLQAIAQWPANLATMLCDELNMMVSTLVARDDWKEILSIVPEHPIHAAATRGHNDALALLLEAKAAVDQQSHNGSTALHLANQRLATGVILAYSPTTYSHTADGQKHIAKTQGCIQLLLAAGASRNCADNSGKKPLSISVLEAPYMNRFYGYTHTSTREMCERYQHVINSL